MKNDIFQRLKHSSPVIFWLYTRIPFLLFVLVEAVIVYVIFWIGKIYFSPGTFGV